jgi:hypothetical protein
MMSLSFPARWMVCSQPYDDTATRNVRRGGRVAAREGSGEGSGVAILAALTWLQRSAGEPISQARFIGDGRAGERGGQLRWVLAQSGVQPGRRFRIRRAEFQPVQVR